MTISGNLPPYYPPNPLYVDVEDEKIQPPEEQTMPTISKPSPKLDKGGINYVW